MVVPPSFELFVLAEDELRLDDNHVVHEAFAVQTEPLECQLRRDLVDAPFIGLKLVDARAPMRSISNSI